MPCIVLFCETCITSKTHITSDMCSWSRCKGVEISLVLCKNITRDIENTSWKVLAYGIYARVVDVSEIERVSAANE